MAANLSLSRLNEKSCTRVLDFSEAKRKVGGPKIDTDIEVLLERHDRFQQIVLGE